MGNTYANVTVVGTTGPAVVEALAGTDAFVADAGDGCVVVFAAADELDGFSAGITAGLLSSELGVPALEMAVFDDDLLVYQVLVDGEVVVSAAVPEAIAEVMGTDDDVPSADAHQLVAALGRGDVAAAEAVLASNPVFVSDLHAQLAKALDLPPWAAAHGWGHLDDGDSEIPVELVRTP
jgi:hypothetical protein